MNHWYRNCGNNSGGGTVVSTYIVNGDGQLCTPSVFNPSCKPPSCPAVFVNRRRKLLPPQPPPIALLLVVSLNRSHLRTYAVPSFLAIWPQTSCHSVLFFTRN